VILAFDPVGQTPVQGVEVDGVLLGQSGEKLGAAGAEEAFGLAFALRIDMRCSAYLSSCRLIGPGMDQSDTELGTDHGKLV